MKNLKKLYPNYFLDTGEFLSYINELKNILSHLDISDKNNLSNVDEKKYSP